MILIKGGDCMFIGREKELRVLENEYNKKGFSMTILYGRRRIGKSTLLLEFIKRKKTIFYTASRVGAVRNLELLSQQVIQTLVPNMSGVSFSSLENLFSFMTNNLSDEKLVFIIDELPYWAEKDEGFLSVLQKYIDNEWLDKNIYIILCGSSLSFMENKVLSEKSPVFGRKTSQIRLDAFDYLDAARFVPNYSLEQKAICYGITGGVAKYLSLIDPKKSLDENIVDLYFDTSGYLYDETRNLLIQEFSDTTLVNNIIEQIAAGQNALNLIADKIHESESAILYQLNKLINVGIVEKKCCITEEKNKKKTQYVLKDYMFKFWYEFIPKGISVIELGNGKLYYEKMVKDKLHRFMGPIFEDMCKTYTLKLGVQDDFGCFITEVGNWWGTEVMKDEYGRKKIQSADIDVVGVSTIDKAIVIGECKFKNEPIDKNIYDVLIRRTKSIPINYVVKKYLLFSLSGYTKYFDEIDLSHTILYTLDDLYKD